MKKLLTIAILAAAAVAVPLVVAQNAGQPARSRVTRPTGRRSRPTPRPSAVPRPMPK